MRKFIWVLFLIFALPGLSQQDGNNSLPFSVIPDYPPGQYNRCKGITPQNP